jgi:hypothetical protein
VLQLTTHQSPSNESSLCPAGPWFFASTYAALQADAHLGDAADDIRILSCVIFLIPAKDLHLPAFQNMDLPWRKEVK